MTRKRNYYKTKKDLVNAIDNDPKVKFSKIHSTYNGGKVVGVDFEGHHYSCTNMTGKKMKMDDYIKSIMHMIFKDYGLE